MERQGQKVLRMSLEDAHVQQQQKIVSIMPKTKAILERHQQKVRRMQRRQTHLQPQSKSLWSLW